MSVKQSLRHAVDELPESVTLEEAFERLYSAFKAKRARAAATLLAEDRAEQTHAALAQMAYLNDAALWQAARSTMTPEQRSRMADLHDKQQRATLVAEEQAEVQTLQALYRETLLVRAQAAVLLKQRGYDIADPGQFAPIE